MKTLYDALKEYCLSYGVDNILTTDEDLSEFKEREWSKDHGGEEISYIIYSDKRIFVMDSYDGKHSIWSLPRETPPKLELYTL